MLIDHVKFVALVIHWEEPRFRNFLEELIKMEPSENSPTINKMRYQDIDKMINPYDPLFLSEILDFAESALQDDQILGYIKEAEIKMREILKKGTLKKNTEPKTKQDVLQNINPKKHKDEL